MSKRSTLAKAALVAVAGAMALGVGGASAQQYGQPYGAYGYNGGYDACQREANGRGVGGAFVGGAIGATVGSQMAARGHRTDGSVLGGVLGALVGAGVGHSTAACAGGPAPAYAPGRAPNAYYGGGYAYAQPYYAPSYDRAYRGGRYDSYADDDWAYGRRGERLRIAEGRVGPDGCTLAESPIYMPDGRTQTRFVRVCMDSRGRYQVVD
jgi:hypothetical protein